MKRFEPTTFPTDISILPLIALVMLTESSGRLVPRATMVSPITKAGILNFFATDDAPSTKQSAPFTNNNSCPSLILEVLKLFIDFISKIQQSNLTIYHE